MDRNKGDRDRDRGNAIRSMVCVNHARVPDAAGRLQAWGCPKLPGNYPGSLCGGT